MQGECRVERQLTAVQGKESEVPSGESMTLLKGFVRLSANTREREVSLCVWHAHVYWCFFLRIYGSDVTV